jgi:hypothetical protein
MIVESIDIEFWIFHEFEDEYGASISITNSIH